jgi:hypothetical protein
MASRQRFSAFPAPSSYHRVLGAFAVKSARDAGEMSSMHWQLFFYREVGKDAKERRKAIFLDQGPSSKLTLSIMASRQRFSPYPVPSSYLRVLRAFEGDQDNRWIVNQGNRWDVG